MSKLLPLERMARLLNVPEAWLAKLARTGEVPSLKVGRSYLFNAEAVERVLLRKADEPDEMSPLEDDDLDEGDDADDEEEDEDLDDEDDEESEDEDEEEVDDEE